MILEYKKLNIKRDASVESFEVSGSTLLDLLDNIKHTKDPSLAYSSGCRSGVCGSCAMVVDGVEVLACSFKPSGGELVEPLRNSPIIRDLVVDMSKALEFNAKAKAYLNEPNAIKIDPASVINELQSSCILCASCYSVCPVYAINGEFLGPFALTRVWKYVSDKRESDPKSKIDNIQQNGIWDCTLCNACTLVCPQGISSKADIEKLRAKSSQYGYMDPNFSSFGFGGGFDGGTFF